MVINLYPFEEVLQKTSQEEDIIENIDYKYNKIIAKECVLFHRDYWVNRYKAMHNKDM